ncbi:MAG TPA: gluconate 2-dehydrogenase subunit 3 family protein [Chitinophagaceae bacterium]|nr:gluconate 2-dehydrogenase subunit 3 family protein [Chitinophagaceae bacterium]
MDRREALSRVALLVGGTVLGANAFLTGCRPSGYEFGEGMNFTENDIAFLDEVAETIIPTTDTPGAKAAKVGAFMTVMVKDCYEPKDQKIFREGMEKLDKASLKKFDKSFVSATPEQRHQLLVQIDKEVKDEMKKEQEARKLEENRQKQAEAMERQKENAEQTDPKTRIEKQQEKPKENPPRHYFRMMKELTLLGYFTSEIGQTQALRYIAVPGRYDGCVDYKKGEKAWA